VPADSVVYWALLASAVAFVIVRRIVRKQATRETLELSALLICTLLPLAPAVLPVSRRAALWVSLVLFLGLAARRYLKQRRRAAAERAVASASGLPDPPRNR